MKLVGDHASIVFEETVSRQLGGARYWEPNAEFDSVSPDLDRNAGLVVTEIKFRSLSSRDAAAIETALARRWGRYDHCQEIPAGWVSGDRGRMAQTI